MLTKCSVCKSVVNFLDWQGWVLEEAESVKHIKAACVVIYLCFSMADHCYHLQI